jgi:hypothetical protein
MSTGPVPDLVIPVRFDMSKIPGQLQQVGAAGQAAAQKTAQGFKQAQQSVDGTSNSILGLMRAQMALGVVQSVAAGIANEFKKTQESLETMGKAFIDLRHRMQEIAVLSGQQGTTKFTVDQAQAAFQDAMKPQERVEAQSAFLNFAGAMIGQGPNARLTTKQGQEFASRAGVMMKAAGYKPAAAMQLAGAMLQQKQGPQNVDQLMKEFSVMFNIAQPGQVPLERAAPDIQELMGTGMTSAEATTSYSVIAGAAPGQERAAVEGAVKAIRQMRVKGTAAEFGVTRQMRPYEAMKAFGRNVTERKRAMMAKGATETEAENDLSVLLAQKEIAADMREAKGLISGAGRLGTELGGFATFEGFAAATPGNWEQKTREAYMASEEGQQAQTEAFEALGEAVEGAAEAPVQRARQEARGALLFQGKMRKPTYGQLVAGSLKNIPGIGAFFDDQGTVATNAEMLRRARIQAGADQPEGFDMLSLSSRVTDERMRDLLAQIDANTKHAAQTNAQMARPPVLAVPAGLPANGHRNGN